MRPPQPNSLDDPQRSSLDHLVGAGEQHRWNIEAERLRRAQIYDEIEIWSAARPGCRPASPAQNLVDIVGGAPEQFRPVCSIRHQTSRFDVLPLVVNRRQMRDERQGVDVNSVGSTSGSPAT